MHHLAATCRQDFGGSLSGIQMSEGPAKCYCQCNCIAVQGTFHARTEGRVKASEFKLQRDAGPELLQSDPTEAADKLETALWVTKSFKSAYEACRIRRYADYSASHDHTGLALLETL